MTDTGKVQGILKEAIQRGLFPGAITLWGRPEGVPRAAKWGTLGRTRNREPVTDEAVYDLASVTKIASTTSLAMIFYERGRLDLNLPLAEGPLAGATPWPVPWRQITAADLLSHQSGLPPWRPLYRLPISEADYQARQAAVITAIASTPILARPGQKTIYSDLNFILLGFLLEALGGDRLDRLFQREIARPLNLTASTYRPQNGPIAPTEDGFRLGGPLGHPEALWRGPVPLGRAHDDNAAFLGGVAGHAGLFSPAHDLWAIVADWSRGLTGRGRVFGPAIGRFIRPRPDGEGGGRALGFDLKTADVLFSSATVGHLGYTGPSLWWDPANDFAWLILCNRVHPSARGEGIADFRHKLMSAETLS